MHFWVISVIFELVLKLYYHCIVLRAFQLQLIKILFFYIEHIKKLLFWYDIPILYNYEINLGLLNWIWLNIIWFYLILFMVFEINT